MSLKVVLLKDVDALGKRGQTVSVSDGYARNYLFPKGLAKPLDEGTVKQLRMEEERARQREAKKLEEARAAKSKLSGALVTVLARAGESGRLYGSITTQDIAGAIKEQLGLDVDRRLIEIPEPIKFLGAYPVRARFAPDVVAEFFVRVMNEGGGGAR